MGILGNGRDHWGRGQEAGGDTAGQGSMGGGRCGCSGCVVAPPHTLLEGHRRREGGRTEGKQLFSGEQPAPVEGRGGLQSEGDTGNVRKKQVVRDTAQLSIRSVQSGTEALKKAAGALTSSTVDAAEDSRGRAHPETERKWRSPEGRVHVGNRRWLQYQSWKLCTIGLTWETEPPE